MFSHYISEPEVCSVCGTLRTKSVPDCQSCHGTDFRSMFDDNSPTIISDVDGTTSNPAKRLHWIKMEKPSWDMFNLECHLDSPIYPIINILRLADSQNWRIIHVTGRDQKMIELTLRWFRRHRVPCHRLYMRPQGDYRSDVDVKKDIYNKHLFGMKNIQFVMEDRDKVVEMWRSLGLNCLQVAKGAY